MFLILLFFLVNTSEGSGRIYRNYNVTRNHSFIHLHPLQTVKLTTDGSDVNKFWVFEAHSHNYSISMSYDSEYDFLINSTDQGLVYPRPRDTRSPSDSETQPFVYLKNTQNTTVKVLVLVRGYTENDPMPGACKPQKIIRPNIEVKWDSSVVNVSFNHAGDYVGTDCNSQSKFSYQVYQLFLPERNLEEDKFFSKLKTFLEPTQIMKNGVAVPSRSKNKFSPIFSAYPATGSLYAVIVKFGNSSAVYVTAHTYACNLDPTMEHNCEALFFTVTQILCALALFVGIFMGFAGHRFFKCSQFIFGFYAGSFVGYILLSKYLDLDWVAVWSLTATCGLAFACLVSALWFFLGIPVLSMFLPLLILGALAASCIMFIPLTDVRSFNASSTYWLVFSCIVLAGPILLLAFTQKASILACVIIGVYTFIIPIDHYMGSSLRYILVNVLRRATIPYFDSAIISPPIQFPDLVLMVCWLGATAVCLIVQLVVERRRAPFPPAPFQQWRWVREEARDMEADENTPLIGNEITVEGLSGQVIRPVNASGPVVGYILGYQTHSLAGSPGSSLPPYTRDRSSNSSLANSVQGRPKDRTSNSNSVQGRPRDRTSNSNSVQGRPRDRTSNSNSVQGRPRDRTSNSNSVQGRPRDRTSNSSLGGRRNVPTSPRERDIFKPPSHDEDLYGTPQ